MELQRLVTVEEIAACLDIFNASMPRPVSSRVGDMGEYACKLHRFGNNYKAVACGQTIGFISYYSNDKRSLNAYLSNIAVRDKEQCHGIGSRMLELAADECRRNGMCVLKLEVDESNERAVLFYVRHGFYKTGPASDCSMYMQKDL